MDTKPTGGSSEINFYEALRSAFRKAKHPKPAEAGPHSHPRRDHGDMKAPAQSWPPGTAHQAGASRRDWNTTW